MAANHFFVGLAAGISILAVPVVVLTPAPQRMLQWIEGPGQPVQITTEDAAANRPVRGYLPGNPTPGPQAVPTIQPPARPTVAPTRPPAPIAQVAPNVSTDNLRWAGTGVIRSSGIPVYVRRVAGVDSGNDPQIPDGSPVLVAYGPPTQIGSQQWVAIRGLNGAIGWVPSSQLAQDGVGGAAPIQVPIQVAAAIAPTPTPEATVPNRGNIANTDGAGVVLRNSPNDADRSRSGLMDGAPVTLLEYAGSDWVHVRADNGQSGWVPTRYVNRS
jgi:SH3-like domain-containing protein